MKTLKLDARAKEMAKEALEFAMENELTFNYSDGISGLSFYFPKKKVVSHEVTYLTWEDREERFKKMIQEAKELI